MGKIIAVGVLLFAVVFPYMAQAGSEGLARELITASGFREDTLQVVKQAGVPSGMLAKVDISAIEKAYVKSLAKHLTDADLKAVITAYSIPGYRAAMRKMTNVSAEMMAEAFKVAQPKDEAQISPTKRP